MESVLRQVSFVARGATLHSPLGPFPVDFDKSRLQVLTVLQYQYKHQTDLMAHTSNLHQKIVKIPVKWAQKANKRPKPWPGC